MIKLGIVALGGLERCTGDIGLWIHCVATRNTIAAAEQLELVVRPHKL